MLLGTKIPHHKIASSIWKDEELFMKQSVSIPFRSDVRKPVLILIIGGSRIGKTTLKSCLIDDLQNDYGVSTLSIYPKGVDAKYHNKPGFGKYLSPGDYNRTLRNRLFMPMYMDEEMPKEIKQGLDKFAFELYDFSPSSEPGFLEDNPGEYSRGVYSNMSIIRHNNEHTADNTAKQMYKWIEDNTATSTKGNKYNNRMYIPMATHEAMKNRLISGIANKFFYEDCTKISEKMFINDWGKKRNHAFMFFTDPGDPRVQAYVAKTIKIAQRAKRTDNSYRRSKGWEEKPIWIVVDDASEVIAEYMGNKERYRAKIEIMRLIDKFGEEGWNVMLTYHKAEDVPEGLIDRADFIITSKMNKRSAAKISTDQYYIDTVSRLFIKEFYYYNEWAVRMKSGQVRTFYAIDSPVGLK